MNKLVATAIVGTGQQSSDIDLSTGTQVDTLASQIQTNEQERKLLLTAGAWATYRLAGHCTTAAPEPPKPALAEQRRACSPNAMQILESLLQSEHDELLPEALLLLERAEQRLPHTLLPLALDYGAKSVEIRPALIRVIGERGLWLSRFNKQWSWVQQFLVDNTQTLPENAEEIWQEGTDGQRSEILRRLRATDPAKAREWLMEVWKKEKVDTRTLLLNSFEVGLSADDEPFLEQVLDQRGEGPRLGAASLLACISTSELTKRMLVRANTMLKYGEGKLTFPAPPDIEPSWERDGIPTKHTRNAKDEKHWRLFQILARISPEYWETTFSASPEELITAAKATKYEKALIEAWTEATLLHHTQHWFAPLIDCWLYASNKNVNWSSRGQHEITNTLLRCLSQKEAENKITPAIGDESITYWGAHLAVLPQPWSKEFSDACLLRLREFSSTLTEHYNTLYQWEAMLTTATISLPYECINAALEPWDIVEVDNKKWQTGQWQQHINTFIDLLTLRKHLIEEITKS